MPSMLRWQTSQNSSEEGGNKGSSSCPEHLRRLPGGMPESAAGSGRPGAQSAQA
ncbi:hypothetical protein [Streptomyces sp. NPDC126514]|uniref:hypothetical protein n=1 Tax=Streptomyces sp. NPDC126514 TaxID=3155210 RepID=UPI00331B428E